MSDKTEAVDAAEEFVAKLRGLDRGDLARLKRCSGRPLQECTEVFPLFYRALPSTVRGREWEERDYFLVASLFALTESARGDMGDAMRRLRAKKQGSEDSLDRRLTILLDCSRDELTFRLRQTIRLLASGEVGLDWSELLCDIRQWTAPWKPTQKKWARSYFGARDVDDNENSEETTQTASEETE